MYQSINVVRILGGAVPMLGVLGCDDPTEKGSVGESI